MNKEIKDLLSDERHYLLRWVSDPETKLGNKIIKILFSPIKKGKKRLIEQDEEKANIYDYIECENYIIKCNVNSIPPCIAGSIWHHSGIKKPKNIYKENMNRGHFTEYTSPPIISNIIELNKELNYLRNRHFIVWRIGGLSKSKNAAHQPKVKIQIKEFIKGPNLTLHNNIKYIHVNYEDSSFFRFGSVWHFDNDSAYAELIQKYEEVRFHVDFSSKGWSYYSISDNEKQNLKELIPPSKYLSDDSFDKWSRNNWMINFKTTNGIKLLVPCMELFTRTYGSSSKLRRSILTHDFDTMLKNLFSPYDKNLEIPNQWNLKIGKYMTKNDEVFLAHLKYDKKVKNIVKELTSNIQTNKLDKPHFLKCPPWVSGKGTIIVSGIRLKESNVFIGLRINGMSYPKCSHIINSIYDKTNLTDGEKGATPDKEPGSDVKLNLINPHEIYKLSQEGSPDHSFGTVVINDELMTWSNPPKIIRTEVITTKTKGDAPGINIAETGSTEDPHGSGNNKSKTVVRTPVLLDSYGTLMDTWNALLYAKKTYPDTIINVESYTLDNGFSSDKIPNLIPFSDSKINESEDRPKSVLLKWNQINKDLLRGLLVARVSMENKSLYVLEISKRLNKAETSESDKFKCLVFMLNETEKLEGLLGKIMNSLQLHCNGSFNIKDFKTDNITFRRFNHNRGNQDHIVCASENIIKRILKAYKLI